MISNVNPYVNLNGRSAEAIEFYCQALGAEVVALMHFRDMPGETPPAEVGDRVMFSCLKLGEQHLHVSDTPPGWELRFGNSTHILLHVSEAGEVDRLYEALKQGGEVVMALETTFWNARYAHVRDRFGVSWMLNFDLAGGGSSEG